MKKLLPLLTSILVLIIIFYIKRNIPELIEADLLEIKIIDAIGFVNRPGVISLGTLTLFAIFTLFKFRYSSLQIWFIYLFVLSYVSRILVGDFIFNIKSLSWLPVFRLSYLTAILASTIIILSLLLEDRSYNEQET